MLTVVMILFRIRSKVFYFWSIDALLMLVEVICRNLMNLTKVFKIKTPVLETFLK